MQPEKTERDLSQESVVHIGPTIEVHLPSSRLITLRESNADDEDLISQSNTKSGTNILTYLNAIIVTDASLGRKPLVGDIEKWGIKDKYYALVASRIHSLGSEFAYMHECSNTKCDYVNPPGSPWKEDLTRYTHNFSGPLPPKEDIDYWATKSAYAATPYPMGIAKEVIFELSSKKLLRYEILDTVGENYLLDMPESTAKRSRALTARNLQIKVNDTWEKVTNFKIFSSKESSEIWSNITKNDMGFAPLSEITCPKCGLKELINVMLEPSFFFPVEI